jgi:hypothetical protein
MIVLLYYFYFTILRINQISIYITKYDDDDKGKKIKFDKINPCLN